VVVAGYVVTCWNCLGEFEATGAVWCSDDPKNPTKLCPFCLRCFCDASAEYKQEFWRKAPAQLVEELQTLGKSQDRLGDVLIRMKKITTPQLLEALRVYVPNIVDFSPLPDGQHFYILFSQDEQPRHVVTKGG